MQAVKEAPAELRKTKLLVLIPTIGVFGILNTEMGIVGVIPYAAERFGVSVPQAGLLVSMFVPSFPVLLAAAAVNAGMFGFYSYLRRPY